MSHGEAISAYPLTWPNGWKRTSSHGRVRARFGKQEFRQYQSGNGRYSVKSSLSVYDAVQRVRETLDRMNARSVIVSTNVPTRIDGFPRSGHREPDDPGACVYWTERNGSPRCMAIDRYDRVADNLCGIAASLEALRAVERHGGASILERAFTGFAALPSPTTEKHWREVMGFGRHVVPTEAEVQEQYRSLAKRRHPDVGGSNEAMAELNRAREDALREVCA